MDTIGESSGWDRREVGKDATIREGETFPETPVSELARNPPCDSRPLLGTISPCGHWAHPAVGG